MGGDTLFASMTAAYEGLSDGMQRYLDGLVAVASVGFESLAEPGGRERLADAVAKNPPVRARLCKPIPDRQESALCEQLIHHPYRGPAPLESAEVPQFLWRHASLPEFTCRFNWQPNSMVLWDNRSTQHKPVNDFFPATRRLHRVVSEAISLINAHYSSMYSLTSRLTIGANRYNIRMLGSAMRNVIASEKSSTARISSMHPRR